MFVRINPYELVSFPAHFYCPQPIFVLSWPACLPVANRLLYMFDNYLWQLCHSYGVATVLGRRLLLTLLSVATSTLKHSET